MKRKIPLQRKTPLRRKPAAVKALKRTPIKRGGSIKKVSDKLAEARKSYSQLSKEYLKAHPICEANVNGCTRVSTEVHHKKGRIGKLLCDPEFFLAVCRSCHSHIELNPASAKDAGFSLSRLSK